MFTAFSSRYVLNKSPAQPYRDAIIRTDSRPPIPARFKAIAGITSAREIRYSRSPWGDSFIGNPVAAISVNSAYPASSGARYEEVSGSIKNATTLITNEAKTIAYNLLFKVVNLNLKSFMDALTSSRSLIYESSKTSVKPLGRADPGSESHTSHCHMGVLQEMRV